MYMDGLQFFKRETCASIKQTLKEKTTFASKKKKKTHLFFEHPILGGFHEIKMLYNSTLHKKNILMPFCERSACTENRNRFCNNSGP